MNRHRTISIRLAAFLIAAIIAFAHGNLEHVVGVVAKVSPGSVTVTTPGGRSVEVVLAEKTTYRKADQAAQKTAIEVGDRVVIHAEKEDGKLIAQTVALGAGKKAAHSH